MTDASAAPVPSITPDRRKTRERLLDAGLELFSTIGVDGTAVRDLEELAGLKPGSGSFYRHFSSKEEVFDEVVEREVDAIRARSKVLRETADIELGDTEAELRLHIKTMLVGLKHMEKFIFILARETERKERLLGMLSESLVRTGRATDSAQLKEKMDRGEIVETDPEALSMIVWQAVMGFFLMEAYFGVSTDEVTSERFVNTLVTLLKTKK